MKMSEITKRDLEIDLYSCAQMRILPGDLPDLHGDTMGVGVAQGEALLDKEHHDHRLP